MVVSVSVVLLLGFSVPVTPGVSLTVCEGVPPGTPSEGVGAVEDAPQPAAKTIAPIRSVAIRRLAVLFIKEHLSLWIHFTNDNVVLHFWGSSTPEFHTCDNNPSTLRHNHKVAAHIASSAP